MNSPSPISERLAAARARLAELESSQPGLAHAAALGAEPARKKFHAAREEIEETRANIDLLEKASIHEAEQFNGEKIARQRRQRDEIKTRALKIARRRTELAATLAQQLAAALGTYRKIHNLSPELIAASPLREPVRRGLLLYPAEIRRAVDAEIVRLDNMQIKSAADLDRTFPRAESPSISMMQGALGTTMRPSLVDVFNEALAALENEINTSAFFPVAQAEPATQLHAESGAATN